jgi:hypothetical protein
MPPSTPIRGWCVECDRETEQCQGPEHVGENRCMKCCGGIHSFRYRICVNCGDGPVGGERETAEEPAHEAEAQPEELNPVRRAVLGLKS